jgi:uncharacterized protein (TIGR00297 family)
VTDRKLNFIFQFILVVLFVLLANPFDKVQILFGLVLAWGSARLVFLNNWLSLDGAWAATIIGTVALGIGGWQGAIVLLGFFVSSNFIVWLLAGAYPVSNLLQLRERRNGIQVWANSFWFVLFLISSYIFDSELFFLMGAAAVATANSDTWASIFGLRFSARGTRLITTMRKTEPGTDGGVSIPGTLAALTGAVFIGLIILLFPRENRYIALIAVVSGGFSGCIVDSYLGAVYQLKNRIFRVGESAAWPVDNDMVNWLATGTGSVICLILYSILDYALV